MANTSGTPYWTNTYHKLFLLTAMNFTRCSLWDIAHAIDCNVFSHPVKELLLSRILLVGTKNDLNYVNGTILWINILYNRKNQLQISRIYNITRSTCFSSNSVRQFKLAREVLSVFMERGEFTPLFSRWNQVSQGTVHLKINAHCSIHLRW